MKLRGYVKQWDWDETAYRLELQQNSDKQVWPPHGLSLLDWDIMNQPDDTTDDKSYAECGEFCENPAHASGTMLSNGMPCWLSPGHKGKHTCPMCPDAFDIDN